MINSFLIIQNDLKEFSDELNSTDWSAFPVSEGSSVWIPILLIIVVFLDFATWQKPLKEISTHITE